MTALKVDGSAVTQPVSGTVTANAGTNLNTSALALDATLTGGTQQSKITDGTNVATVKAASTAAGATDKALVVAISPNNTVPVSAASLPLPTGAATETTLAAASAKLPATLGQKTMANSLAVVIASDQSAIPVSGTVSTTAVAVTASTLSNVAASATSVTLLASNASRKAAFFFNDSTSNLYLKFGATASSTSFTSIVYPNEFFQIPTPLYTGVVDGIWVTATGTVRVTELT